MINGLGEVPDFGDSLMHELDSDLMNMDDDSDSNCIMQHMDIREPLSKLKKLLEQRVGFDLPGYQFCLQGNTMVSIYLFIIKSCGNLYLIFCKNCFQLESHKNLVDQCVQGEGLVQINVHIQSHLKRINIIDVLKPAEDYIDMGSFNIWHYL